MTDTLTLRAPDSVDACLAQMAQMHADMPKRLRQCADFAMTNSDRLAVLTVAEMAEEAGVPPSAVMRFCQVLGFRGFSDMQRLFRAAYAPRFPDYATRLANLKSHRAGSPAALLAEFVEAGRLSLESLAKTVDESSLVRAAQVLAGAQVLHLVGMRRAFPVASYLAYLFEKMAIPAMLHDGIGGLDHAQALRAGDAMIAISFPPYASETLELAAKARAKTLPVIALTDQVFSPLARLADVSLRVEDVDFGAFRSLSATLALATTLAVAVGSHPRAPR